MHTHIHASPMLGGHFFNVAIVCGRWWFLLANIRTHRDDRALKNMENISYIRYAKLTQYTRVAFDLTHEYTCVA